MSPPDTSSWTDAGQGDPGVAILELLAYLADDFGYRQDAVAAANRRRTVFVAAVAGAIAGVLVCSWLCARRASSDR
jgi:hypothetical protein